MAASRPYPLGPLDRPDRPDRPENSDRLDSETKTESGSFDPEEIEAEGGRSQVDALLDELVPPDLDWRRIVRRYPIPALLVAGAAGYWLGRSKKGAAIAESLAGAVALGVTRELIDADLENPFDDDPLG